MTAPSPEGQSAESPGSEYEGTAAPHTPVRYGDNLTWNPPSTPATTPSAYSQPQAEPQPTYAQPTYMQPTYAQPTHVQPRYPQPTYAQPTYAQPTYPQPYAMAGFGTTVTTQFAGRRANPVHVFIAWVFAIASLAYFLPWAIAASRAKSNSVAIALVNFLLGWTVVGWIIALLMACGAEPMATTHTATFAGVGAVPYYPPPSAPPTTGYYPPQYPNAGR